MGNITSQQQKDSPNNKKSLSEVINYVAANYILTQNFQDMKNLSNMKYCNKLVVITSKIFEDNLDTLEVNFLAQRLKNGVTVNEMTKDKITFINTDNLSRIDEKNKTQKRRMCIGIAKYYVKIAHIFAAIVTTLNPVYSYKDSTGTPQKLTLLNKTDLPKDATPKIDKINLCSKRLNALVNKNDYNVDDNTEITINPNFCSMNLDSNSKNTKTFSSEPGIPELKQLYFDKYNYDDGGFTGMTDKTKKQYLKDVQLFYKQFTGDTEIPLDSSGNPKITNFSDIPLKNFHKTKGCFKNGEYTQKYKGNLKDKLFSKYAEHIKKMMQTTTTNQNKLIDIIDEIFIFNLNPETKRREIVINPKLTEDELQKIVEKTRNIIVNLYLQCENDFLIGLEIFEAIIEKQILETSKEQIEELDQNIEKTRSWIPPDPIDDEILTDEILTDETPISETQTDPITDVTPVNPVTDVTPHPPNILNDNNSLSDITPVATVPTTIITDEPVKVIANETPDKLTTNIQLPTENIEVSTDFSNIAAPAAG